MPRFERQNDQLAIVARKDRRASLLPHCVNPQTVRSIANRRLAKSAATKVNRTSIRSIALSLLATAIPGSPMPINSIAGNTLLISGSFPPVRVATTGGNLNLAAGGLLLIDGVQLV